MYDNFMTSEVLTTFVGLVLTTNIIVQFTKSIIKKQLGDEFVRLYAFIIALILTFVFSKTGEGIQGIIITIINAILVTMAAMGGYEMVSDPLAQKKK
ncbi:hypothetical protein EDD65_10322 [Keratinibaculum paraultunense]|uniref:Holin n=1 Tax=Keratinibaculum paraultunense TaxID=1278232 RepID=A0A4R3KZZ0_9FIRM|nr:hypothetical protein [Keratinibaculum paraultunense]QQY80208.1 hypothetical protein JL105_02405 [Keratinibaculum paraultunense]TCS90719.1 hypothetical protein EDD65_10322 [Keratinibaculum paraultunense]